MLLKLTFLSCCFLLLANCGVGGNVYRTPPVTVTAPTFKVLSLHDSRFTTCNYPPHFKIAHFPMYHFPPDGKFKPSSFELITHSQFQLLHTILNNHNNIVVFEESVQHDVYTRENLNSLNNYYFIRSDQKKFEWNERQNLAKHLFPTIPLYYEHLTEPQKQYIYDTGGVLTLFFLNQIHKIYKTITRADFDVAWQSLIKESERLNSTFNDILSTPKGQNRTIDYWVFEYREQKLFQEVSKFYQKNPNYKGLVLIAYGINHDFSDDFLGYSFSTGNHCVQWLKANPSS